MGEAIGRANHRKSLTLVPRWIPPRPFILCVYLTNGQPTPVPFANDHCLWHTCIFYNYLGTEIYRLQQVTELRLISQLANEVMAQNYRHNFVQIDQGLRVRILALTSQAILQEIVCIGAKQNGLSAIFIIICIESNHVIF